MQPSDKGEFICQDSSCCVPISTLVIVLSSPIEEEDATGTIPVISVYVDEALLSLGERPL